MMPSPVAELEKTGYAPGSDSMASLLITLPRPIDIVCRATKSPSLTRFQLERSTWGCEKTLVFLFAFILCREIHNERKTK